VLGGGTGREQLVLHIRSGHTGIQTVAAEGDGHRTAHLPRSVGISTAVSPTCASSDRSVQVHVHTYTHMLSQTYLYVCIHKYIHKHAGMQLRRCCCIGEGVETPAVAEEQRGRVVDEKVVDEYHQKYIEAVKKLYAAYAGDEAPLEIY
jgi:hypothetical protein